MIRLKDNLVPVMAVCAGWIVAITPALSLDSSAGFDRDGGAVNLHDITDDDVGLARMWDLRTLSDAAMLHPDFCTIITEDGKITQLQCKRSWEETDEEITAKTSHETPADWYIAFKEYFINYFHPVVRAGIGFKATLTAGVVERIKFFGFSSDIPFNDAHNMHIVAPKPTSLNEIRMRTSIEDALKKALKEHSLKFPTDVSSFDVTLVVAGDPRNEHGWWGFKLIDKKYLTGI